MEYLRDCAILLTNKQTNMTWLEARNNLIGEVKKYIIFIMFSTSDWNMILLTIPNCFSLCSPFAGDTDKDNIIGH